MSKQDGARTRASAVRAQLASRIAAGDASRLAAAGLALFLTFGYGAAAQAGEGSDRSSVSEGGAAEDGAVQVGGTADAGGDARSVGQADAGSHDEADRLGEADGTIEISATSSDTDLVTLVVVTADGRRTTTVKPSQDATDAAAGPGQLRRAGTAVAAAAADKDKKPDDEKPGKDNKPVDDTRPQTGKPEDAGHQEIVVCHNGRTIVIDSHGADNGHGVDELCDKPLKDTPVSEGDQTGSGGDVATGGVTGGAGDQTDTGDQSDTGSEGGDGATVGDEGSSGAVDGEDMDATTPRHSEQEDGSAGDSTPKGENGAEVVVALPGQDDTIERGPVVGKPGAGKPGAGKPGAGKPADQVKGEGAERSGAKQPAGKAPSGSRPAASPAGATGANGAAIVPGSAQLPGQRTGDEILGAAEGSARNRPGALVLPQTGAAESLGLQTGAGLLMVLAGAMTLRGRRRSEG